ncbi:MAG: radical SAM protein, partial [Bdellovibrionota bacterium]
LGYQTVWSLLAKQSLVHCDRVFLPEPEDFPALKERGGELLGFDSLRPAREAHLVAFAVSFESDYLNVLSMLRLLGIPPLRKDRTAGHPVLLAGGIGPTLNPHALTEFFDAIYLGEFEPAAESFGRLSHALAMGELSKDEFLMQLRPEDGFLVPLRPETYGAHPNRLNDLNSAPAWSEFVTPHSEFPNKVLVELERGCPFSCRFCAAGYAYGASRRLELPLLEKIVDEALERFGREETSFGLIGGALTEYKWIVPLARYIAEEKNAKFSLSSMRLKRIDPELLSLLAKSGQRQVTVAPETGSERLRNVIKKNYSDAEVLESVRLAVEAGLSNVKLYSMAGLPTETDDDIRALADLARRCREVMVLAAKGKGRRPGEVIVSVGPFVPKPGTPFERAPFAGEEVLERRYELLRDLLRREPNTELRTEGIRNAYLETFLSRLTEADVPLLLQLHEHYWNGESLGKMLRAFSSEIDRRVFGWESKDEFAWQSVQDEKTQARLEREWHAALDGRISA